MINRVLKYPHSEGDKILEIELKDNQVETQLKTEEIKTIKKENTKEKKIEIRREVERFF